MAGLHADEHYIGIDCGTSSVRACLIDVAGHMVADASCAIQTWHPRPEIYEQSTADIWVSVSSCVKSVMEKSYLQPENIKGIGFDATCSLAVLSGSTQTPISISGPDFRDTSRNVILWMDQRCGKETDEVNATNHDILQYFGGKMMIELELPKVLWLKRNMPKNLFEDCEFFDLVDALTVIACGHDSDGPWHHSAISLEGHVPLGVDGSIKGWSREFLACIGLPELAEDDFKRMGGLRKDTGMMFAAGECIGTLCKEAANSLGLVEGIKIGSGMIDAYAGWIGTVGASITLANQDSHHTAIKEGVKVDEAFTRIAAVAGTSTCHMVMSRNPIFTKGLWGPYRDVILPGFYMSEGGQSVTGALLDHLITTHPAYTTAARLLVHSQAKNIFDFLNGHLEKMRELQNVPHIGYLAKNLFFYGDYHGNRTPISSSGMRGAIIGLTMDVSLDNLAITYYVAMEFIAQQTRHIITCLNDAGHEISSIFVSGGQSRNPLLVQLIANATRFPVVKPHYTDHAVVFGAAMMGAKASTADIHGKTEDLWTIMNRMSKPGAVIYPTKDEDELRLLEAKYQVFLKMISSQQEYRDIVDTAVGRKNLCLPI